MSSDEMNAEAAGLQAEIDGLQASRAEIVVAAVSGDDGARAQLDALDADMGVKVKRLGEVKLGLEQMRRRVHELEVAEAEAADQARRAELRRLAEDWRSEAQKVEDAAAALAAALGRMDEIAEPLRQAGRRYHPAIVNYSAPGMLDPVPMSARLKKALRKLGVLHWFQGELSGTHIGLSFVEQENPVADYFVALADGDEAAGERAAGAYFRNDIASERVEMAGAAERVDQPAPRAAHLIAG